MIINKGDKRIIELEAQIDMLDHVLSDLNDLRFPAAIGAVAAKALCIQTVEAIQREAEQELAQQVDEKYQAAEDDYMDRKMEEARGG